MTNNLHNRASQMLYAMRIFVTMILLTGAILAPAIALTIAHTDDVPNPALFLTGMAIMTPTI